MEKEDIIIKLDKGEGQEEFRLDLLDFINSNCKKYNLNYYELLGIIDVIREDIHEASQNED